MWACKNNKRRGAGASSPGFTLLEVMVAVAILAIALTAVFRLQGQTASMSSRAKFETTAPLLANRIMAGLMAASEDGLVSDSGDFGEKYPHYTWTTQVEDTTSEILEDTAQRLKKITVTVTWGGGVYTNRIRTYRFVPW